MLFEENQMFLNYNFKNKDETMRFIANQAFNLGIIENKEKLYEELWEREKEYSTAIQEMIAIPHSKSRNIKESKLLFIKLKKPIDWESSENFKVSLIFVILVPEKESNIGHLKILSEIAKNLLEDEFIKNISEINDKKKLIEYFNKI